MARGHTPPEPTAKTPTAPPKPRATRAKATPKPVRIKVSYSVGLKVNMGNYESADFHLNESQEWDVDGLSPTAVVKFADEVRGEIAKRLSDEAVAKALAARGVEEEDDDGKIVVRREVT